MASIMALTQGHDMYTNNKRNKNNVLTAKIKSWLLKYLFVLHAHTMRKTLSRQKAKHY